MAYSKDKLQPSNDLYTLLAPVVFKDVRSTSEHKSERVRQCFKCCGRIEAKEQYINHQFKYDKRIITLSFHVSCFNGC